MKIAFCFTVCFSSFTSAFVSLKYGNERTCRSSLPLNMKLGSFGLNDRRAFFHCTSSLITSSILIPPALADELSVPEPVDYTAVAIDIANLVKSDPDKGPTLIRLAWHSSGTYDKMSKTGGSQLGTIRFKEEFSHGGNAGLADTAILWMEDIKKKYGDGLSYADLYTLAGVVAVKSLGGPQVPWNSGRKDSLTPNDVTPDGRLPAADSGPAGADKSDAAHLREIFGRMGFNDQEIVALSGAHALGRCHTTASGYDGPWTPTPTIFNNAYFTLLTSIPWKQREWDGPFQYEGAKGTIMMLPTDLVLVKDKSFQKYVKAYAKDEALFMKDFSAAFAKLLNLGTSNLTPVFT